MNHGGEALELETWQLGVLALTGVFAGVVNTVAGGGSLIALPVMIILGLPPGVANATNRVGVVLQSAVATWQFKREDALDTRMGLWLLLPTCLGSALGAALSVDIDEQLFRRVIGVVMILMLGVVLARPKRWLDGDGDRDPKALWWQVPAFFAIGVYGGFLQAGVGIFLLAGLVLLTGRDLVKSNGIKVLLVCGFTLPPLLIFVINDLIAWVPGLALASGSMLGGWLGTKMTVSWGPSFVRWVLIAVVAISSVRLLLT